MKETSNNSEAKNEPQTLNDAFLMFKEAIRGTKESIDELSELLNDLADTAKANNGKIVNVNDIARQVFGEIDNKGE